MVVWLCECWGPLTLCTDQEGTGLLKVHGRVHVPETLSGLGSEGQTAQDCGAAPSEWGTWARTGQMAEMLPLFS